MLGHCKMILEHEPRKIAIIIIFADSSSKHSFALIGLDVTAGVASSLHYCCLET